MTLPLEKPQVPGGFSSRSILCLNLEPRGALAGAQVSPHHIWLLISESSPSLPESWQAGEENARPLFPPPLRRGQRNTHARAYAHTHALQPQLPAQSLAPRLISQKLSHLSRGVLSAGPLPSSQVRGCAHRGDSSCPFPVKPRQGKKIHATFQRKL